MVKHVLMIKLKDNSKEQCEKLRDLFMTMHLTWKPVRISSTPSVPLTSA